MAYKRPPFPLIQGTQSHKSALKQVNQFGINTNPQLLQADLMSTPTPQPAANTDYSAMQQGLSDLGAGLGEAIKEYRSDEARDKRAQKRGFEDRAAMDKEKAKDKKQKAQDRQAIKDARKTKDKEQRKKDVQAAKQKRKANRAARKGKYKIKK